MYFDLTENGALSKYDLNDGATCKLKFRPITSNWKDCEIAARALGFTGDSLAHVDYEYPWGTQRPQGCFRGTGSGRFHFNKGLGGNFIENDQILCQRIGIGNNIIVAKYQ